jgi:polyhydroxyalkanoate synthesis repressor PhaR
MPNERIIKKYPNRRLYDTKQSKYITLTDVRGLVMDCVRFRVVDTASNEDITRQILMQIIIEEETGGKPLFSAEMLAQLIRFYGGTMQGLFARYLEESFNLFAQQQEKAGERLPINPIEMFNSLTQQNLKMWNSLQQSFMNPAGVSSGSDDKQEKSS